MQGLEKFKNEMNLSGKNVYVGHRYVPKLDSDWDNTKLYEPLTIVTYQGNSFTSRQYVPTGVEINNEEYWVSTGNYNAQVEQYRQEVRAFDNRIKANETLSQSAINDLKSRGVNALENGVKGDGVTDDTQAIKDLIRDNTVVLFTQPPVTYRITDEIVIPSNRKIIFMGGNHWNVNNARNVKFTYDGVTNLNKAMFRASQSPVGVEPFSDTSNILFSGGVLLDGNNKIGYGFYGSFITNESIIDGITVTNTLKTGIDISKSWYCRYSNFTAKSNQGQGIVIGRNFWGGINGCLFENMRAWGNGLDESFTETDYTNACGMYVSLGYASTIQTLVSERNFGAGLVFEHAGGSSNKLTSVYLEGNGEKARDSLKTDYNWGLIVKALKGGGLGNVIETLYLSSGTPSQQSVWLTGENPSNPITLRDVSGGANGGVFISDFENYIIDNTPFSTKITGHLPKKTTDIINSNYTTLYVSTTGSDTNDGRTSDEPLLTIEKAVEILKRINTINTLNIAGLQVVNATVNLKDVHREITIQGDVTTKIGTTSSSSGLNILNGTQSVNIVNVGKINRLNITNAKVIADGVTLGNEDNSNKAVIEVKNADVLIKNGTIDSNLSSSAIKRALRLDNSKVTLVATTVNDFPTTNALTLSGGSTLIDDTFKPVYHTTVFTDGTGYVVAGKRMLIASGYVYNGDV